MVPFPDSRCPLYPVQIFRLLAIAFLLEKVPESVKKSLPGRICAGSLAWCGQRTLELYLIHVGIREIMKKAGFSTGRYVLKKLRT